MKRLMTAVASALAFATGAFGVDLWVDQKAVNASDANAGSEAAPLLTIQAAINAVHAQGGGTVKVKPGVYDQGGQTDPSGLFCRADLSCGGVSLEGVGDRAEIVIVGARDPESSDPYGRARDGRDTLRLPAAGIRACAERHLARGRDRPCGQRPGNRRRCAGRGQLWLRA